jgi:hypothetical protein
MKGEGQTTFPHSIAALWVRSRGAFTPKLQRSRFLGPTRALKKTRARLTGLRNDSSGGMEA